MLRLVAWRMRRRRLLATGNRGSISGETCAGQGDRPSPLANRRSCSKVFESAALASPIGSEIRAARVIESASWDTAFGPPAWFSGLSCFHRNSSEVGGKMPRNGHRRQAAVGQSRRRTTMPGPS